LERAVLDALSVDRGASNPRGIARSLVDMADGYTSEGDAEKRKLWAAAIQVTVNQLLWVVAGGQVSDGAYYDALHRLQTHVQQSKR